MSGDVSRKLATLFQTVTMRSIPLEKRAELVTVVEEAGSIEAVSESFWRFLLDRASQEFTGKLLGGSNV